jgi:hypothetical protein
VTCAELWWWGLVCWCCLPGWLCLRCLTPKFGLLAGATPQKSPPPEFTVTTFSPPASLTPLPSLPSTRQPQNKFRNPLGPQSVFVGFESELHNFLVSCGCVAILVRGVSPAGRGISIFEWRFAGAECLTAEQGLGTLIGT